MFVSLPGQVLLDAAPLQLGASTPVDSRSRPSDPALEALADRLLGSAAPVIIAGDQICTGDAWGELAAVAERLGAPVYHQSVAWLSVFPSEHPLYMGELTRNQERVRRILESHDLLFMVGGEGLRMSVAGAVEPVPAGLPIVQVSTRDWELGKNYPAEIALDADAGETLAALLPVLERRMDAPAREAARVRGRAAAAENWSAKREGLLEQAGALSGKRPIRAEYLMKAIAEAVPEHGVVVDEGLTASRSLLGLLPVRDRQRYYGLASGGIGWGIAGAVGVQLALPERPVLAVIGDGSSLYSIQALWSAANLELPVTFVIANNGGYSILKERLIAFGGSSVARETMIGMDFTPPIGFGALAGAMGLQHRRVEAPGDLDEALRWGLAEPGPVLLDVAVFDPYRIA